MVQELGGEPRLESEERRAALARIAGTRFLDRAQRRRRQAIERVGLQHHVSFHEST